MSQMMKQPPSLQVELALLMRHIQLTLRVVSSVMQEHMKATENSP